MKTALCWYSVSGGKYGQLKGLKELSLENLPKLAIKEVNVSKAN